VRLGVRPLLGLLGATAIVAALPGAAPAAAAASQLVAVVVDFGPGGPAPIVKCVDISGQDQMSDIQVLSEAVSMQNVRLCTSGLLAGIDLYPASGCGQPVAGSHYAYWAYFQGSAAGWSYASTGPASHAASPQSAIGFRFEPEGTGTSSDPAPSESSNPALDCPVSAASSSPTTTLPSGVGSPATTGGATAPVGTTTTTEASHAEVATTTTTARVAAHGASANESSAIGTSTHGGSGSSAAPTVIAVALFAVVGGGAALLVRRRRRAA
jgi:hypothetical protein